MHWPLVSARTSICLSSPVCVEILCPQTERRHTCSYMFSLEQTSVSLGNVWNLRALTSPMNLKNEKSLYSLSVWYNQVLWFHIQGLLVWQVLMVMLISWCNGWRWSQLCEMYLKTEGKTLSSVHFTLSLCSYADLVILLSIHSFEKEQCYMKYILLYFIQTFLK